MWECRHVYVSYKEAKAFREQMTHSVINRYKLKSRCPGGQLYENVRYEWYRFGKNMNWKWFKVLIRQVACYCLGSRITEILSGTSGDEGERMISRFTPDDTLELFHWTSQENVDSIMNKGLQSGTDTKYVYLTDDAEYIARSGYFFYKVDQEKRDMRFVLLKIDALQLSEKYKVFCVDAPHEYAVSEVPAEYITVCG